MEREQPRQPFSTRPGRRLFAAATILASLAIHDAAALIEVRQDGSADATTIAGGIALSSPGEEIRITDSATYMETGLTLTGGRHLESVPVGATLQGAGVPLTVVGAGDQNTVAGLTIVSDATCMVLEVQNGDQPIISNCTFNGTTTLVTGLEVRNNVTIPFPAGALVRLEDLNFSVLGHALVNTNLGPGNQFGQFGCAYSAEALDFSTIGGDAIRFERPAQGAFTGVLANGISGAVVSLRAGARFCDLTFNQLNATNFMGSGVELEESQAAIFLTNPSLTGGQHGVRVGSQPGGNPGQVEIAGGAITGASENAIRLDAPVNLTLGATTLTAAGAAFPAGVGLYASDMATAMFVTANGTIFQNNGGASLHAVSGTHGTLTNLMWSFADCQFLDGADGEVFFDGSFGPGNQLSFDRCLFRESTARAGGGGPLVALNDVDASFANCVIDLNANSGIAHTGAKSLSLIHCTLAAPGGVAVDGVSALTSALTVRNSIIDVPSGGAVIEAAGWTESHNCFRGLISPALLPISADSVVANPVFTTPSTGSGTADFAPTFGSPCPGHGDPGVGLTVDIDGNPRPVPMGSNPDMGAIETILLPVEVSGFGLE